MIISKTMYYINAFTRSVDLTKTVNEWLIVIFNMYRLTIQSINYMWTSLAQLMVYLQTRYCVANFFLYTVCFWMHLLGNTSLPDPK